MDRFDEAMDAQAFAGSLAMWTVYDRPRDWPQHFVARLWLVVPGDPQPVATSHVLKYDSLEELRGCLGGPLGLHCIGRQPQDDPKIVEVWL